MEVLMNNKAIMGTLVVVILFLLGAFMVMYSLGAKIDRQSITMSSLDTKLAAIEASNKMLASTCTAPAPVREPASIPTKEAKKLLRDNIYTVVFSHGKELNKCYAKRLNKKSDQRRMIVSLEIKNSGEVIDANTVNSDIKNKKVEDCIISLIKSINFPTFDGDLFKDEIYINFDSRSLI